MTPGQNGPEPDRPHRRPRSAFDTVRDVLVGLAILALLVSLVTGDLLEGDRGTLATVGIVVGVLLMAVGLVRWWRGGRAPRR